MTTKQLLKIAETLEYWNYKVLWFACNFIIPVGFTLMLASLLITLYRNYYEI